MHGKQTQIKFMGHLITNDGVQADKSKVDAILSMPAPTDVHGVKRFCGMIQYLSKFLPNLASDLQPIRELTRKDAEWNWPVECEEAFQKVKQKITDTPVLVYFDPDKAIKMERRKNRNPKVSERHHEEKATCCTPWL